MKQGIIAGNFDVIHPGYIHMFNECKENCDKLIVMLFDECVSHFDFHHRVVLFEQIRLLHDSKTNKGSFHALMTGTDKELFSPLDGHASFFHVAPSFIQKG